MSGIRLWNGDICDLEVDAIVAPAPPSLWMSTGVGAAIKQRGGHGIEFEAVALGPQQPGTAVATGAGSLNARHIVHAVSLGTDRRLSAPALEASTRAAVRLADSLGLRTIAFPSLGSPVGGVSIAESARIMLGALRDELGRCASIDEIVVAVPGARTYATFHAELVGSQQVGVVPVVPGPDVRGVPVVGEPSGSAERHPTGGRT
jgi:O-acetyl-ADP-ribose deacetylase (regulator of RNase III)